MNLENIIKYRTISLYKHRNKTDSLEDMINQMDQACNGTFRDYQEAMNLCSDTTILTNNVDERLKVVEGFMNSIAT